jgi:hypothetical protein
MRFTLKPRRNDYEWHDYFTLIPRVVEIKDGRAVLWLTTIERKLHLSFHGEYPEYREKV